MRIAIWATMYPLPGYMHQGHAVQKLAYALREFCPDHHTDVYLFISPIGKRLLTRFLEKYQIKADALKAGPYEPGLHFRPIPILPKNMLARWINPFWQRHILSNIGANIECDLILVHMCNHLLYGAVLAGEKRGVPVVLELQRDMGNPGSHPSWKKKLLFEAVHDGGPAYRGTAKFGPVKSVSSEVHVISEGRIIDLSGGYFADSFEPLGTHIYKIALN